jgi:hypothetical protein
MRRIEKFSLGVGDRFAHQGVAQLQAVADAHRRGIEIAPVWNKSGREHSIIRSEPMSVRHEAQTAVADLKWTGPYHVDADHVHLGNVDRFIEASDFFTIDVATFIDEAAEESEVEAFVKESRRCFGVVSIPGLSLPLIIDHVIAESAARKFLASMQEAGRIHRHIAKLKGDDFIAEISVDETDQAQSPAELLLILLMLARARVPCQTIAPKFTGRFNCGVDYVGDLARFEREFEESLCVTRFAIAEFGLPFTLKLSVHSGSDKFSLYPIINRLLKKHDAGIHVKTAGTTWLEELLGLAESEGEGLAIAREIYVTASSRYSDLVKPYAKVIDIDPARLPNAAEVAKWTSAQFVAALRHDRDNPAYNPHFRQLLHCSYKVAVDMGSRFIEALQANQPIIARNVTRNLLDRHILPIFA